MARSVKTQGATWDVVGKSADSAKIETALKACGLAFDVEKRPLFFGPDMKAIKDKAPGI